MLIKLNPKQEAVVQSFAHFISDAADPETLAKELDAVMWSYANYMLKDPMLSGNTDNANAIYWLKELRDILNTK